MCPVRTPAWQQTFQYDGFGNLTAKSVPNGSGEPTYPVVSSATNRLVGPTYDADGNVTAINGLTLGYDGENRMVTSATGSAVDTNVYDEQGHRVWQSRSTGANLGYFYGQDGKLLSVFNLQLSDPQATYVGYHQIYIGGLLLGTASAFVGGEHSTIIDRVGSRQQTYAYGTDVPSQASQQDASAVDFATYLNDSGTGFQYADRRWYSAGYGRFLSADPLGASAKVSGPGTWNRYSYSIGDPVGFHDPTGLDVVCTGASPNGEGITSDPNCVDEDGSSITVSDTQDPVLYYGSDPTDDSTVKDPGAQPQVGTTNASSNSANSAADAATATCSTAGATQQKVRCSKYGRWRSMGHCWP